MKYLKSYKIFEKVDLTTAAGFGEYSLKVHDICKKYGIKNYTIRLDGKIDIEGTVDLYNKKLTKLPLNFGTVTGHFSAANNFLTSLEGCPESVGLDITLFNNKLTSLIGLSTYIGDSLYITSNYITDFKYLNNIKELHCVNNPIYQIWILFRDVSKIELFNDYDPIRIIDNKPTIILDRLNEFLLDIGAKEITKLTKHELSNYYKII